MTLKLLLLFYYFCLSIQKFKQDELLLKLMQSDVVIYNIADHANQVEEAFWAVSGKSSFNLVLWISYVYKLCLYY